MYYLLGFDASAFMRTAAKGLLFPLFSAMGTSRYPPTPK
jgi:hypothetical protein